MERIAKPPVAVKEIIEKGIENFIEQGCQEVCQYLWSLNIDTFESSNNDVYPYAYVSMSNLSVENMSIFKKCMEQNPDNYFIEPFKGAPGIKVKRTGTNVADVLLQLAEVFVIQDVNGHFISVNDFIVTHTKTEAKISYDIEPDGTLVKKINGEINKELFAELLTQSGMTDLYVENERRVYESAYYLNKHREYVAIKNEEVVTRDKG